MNNDIKSISSEIRNSLIELAKVCKDEGINKSFIDNGNRVNDYSHRIEELYFDFSKTHIRTELIKIYSEYAKQINFTDKRTNLFSGEKINVSENRAVLHTLLRDATNQGITTVNKDYIDQATSAHNEFLSCYKRINDSLLKRKTPIKNILHVGIGGSALGTKLVYESLTELEENIRIHFISNIDAHQLISALQHCDVSSTLIIVASKTFTTQETLTNLESIGKWFFDNGDTNFLDNVIAVTANYENAFEYGLNQDQIITFPEWVGGRFSVWSSVSLSVALVIGIDKFEEFLKGASTMDRYFYKTNAENNVCFLAAALDHFYTNYFDTNSKAVFAYDYRLRSLVDYLQQLETESNGKDRQLNGDPVDQKTSPVVWGGVGTEVQHSVFQMMHQGTAIIPAEFILVQKPSHKLNNHHTELLANGLAQSAALLSGQSLEKVKELAKSDNLNSSEIELRAKVFNGERPSSTILLKSLSPKSLGLLLAFYEHRTYCAGILTNINSYDQMGVELGKRIAKSVKPMLHKDVDDVGFGEQGSSINFDSSTKKLIDIIKS